MGRPATTSRLRRPFALLLAAGVIAWLAVVGGTSAATAAPPARPVVSPKTAGACPAGMLGVTARGATWCRHAAMDVAPPRTVRSAAPVQPKCYGNGVNGPRVRLIYAYSDRQPNRAATLVPRILSERAAVIEGNFRTTSKEQGRELGVRFYAPGCKLSVTVVAVPHEIAFADTFTEQIGALAAFMRQQGFKGADRIHHLWLDAPAGKDRTPPCGVALQAATRFAPALGDNPTPANLNNLGNLDQVPSIAVTFRNASPLLDRGPNGPAACWDRITETHEILHTFGAVQFSSPNSDKAAHCRDGQDIMCYGPGLKVRCQSAVAQLDCGSDDYFAINPAPGSYLSTNWNTARSIFLGDAIGLDLLPVEIPRP